MLKELKTLGWYALGFICGMMVMAAAISHNIQNQALCQEELTTCQETLNNPHACVSVVVEVLEGHYEQTNLNND